MEKRELLKALLTAEKVEDALQAVEVFRKSAGASVVELPVGARPNNRGTIEVATDPGRSVIERITNAIDAALELEHAKHSGKPVCQTPREAAQAWFGVDPRGLGYMSQKARQDLARMTVIRLEPGEGREARIVTVRDHGIGLRPQEMAGTILSLNEGNKWQKHYLAGTFGQGGSSTFAFGRLTLIASRHHADSEIGFTVVWYKDLPADEYKSGHYVYVAEGSAPLVVAADEGGVLEGHGTVIRHFGYDLTNYPSPFGERSLYGAMNRLMFDPVAPIWFENRVEGWNRGIYGSRNRLNSGSEDGEGGSKLDLDHRMPMFTVNLGEFGSVGIEYWVLPPAEKSTTIPSAAYVDHRKPIVLSINGQNQDELSALLIRKDSELPYLKSRLICHVDCDGLSPSAKRSLFSSTREKAKEGYILARIRDELVENLRSDDDLKRLNREAKEKSLTEQDDDAKRRLQREVARMLHLQGRAQVEIGKSSRAGAGGSRSSGGSGQYRKIEPLETREPPTYIKILTDDDPFSFYAGQRRWLRIETDANSDYHDPNRAKDSKVNFIVGDHLKVVGSTGLRGGRMRFAVECLPGVPVGAQGTIRVELYRQGLASLSAEAAYEVVPQPKPKDTNRAAVFPDFEFVKVDGPEDVNWSNLTDVDTDIAKHASRAQMDEGTLYIYYSARFPKFEAEFNRWAAQDSQRAASFERRYKVWLAVHSLLMHEQEEQGNASDDDEHLRQERCRVAVVAAMVASQEVRSGDTGTDSEE